MIVSTHRIRLALRLALRRLALRLALRLAIRLALLRLALRLAIQLALRLMLRLALRLVLRLALRIALRLVLRLALSAAAAVLRLAAAEDARTAAEAASAATAARAAVADAASADGTVSSHRAGGEPLDRRRRRRSADGTDSSHCDLVLGQSEFSLSLGFARRVSSPIPNRHETRGFDRTKRDPSALHSSPRMAHAHMNDSHAGSSDLGCTGSKLDSAQKARRDSTIRGVFSRPLRPVSTRNERS